MSEPTTSQSTQKASEEPTRDVKDAFDLFDINKDGVIDAEELKIAFNSIGFEFNQQEVERIISEVDTSNKGTIDLEHFSELIQSKMAEREQIDQIQTAFDMLDFDRTGKISFKNLKQIEANIKYTFFQIIN